MSSTASSLFSNALVQVKINKNGGQFENGKALPRIVREKIIERHLNGERCTRIASSLHVTHGVVSKIVRHYENTGSIDPIPRAPRRRCSPNSTPQHSNVRRHRFSSEQLTFLAGFFATQPYPSKEQFAYLAQVTGCSVPQIEHWFNNKRCRVRKSELKKDSNNANTSPVPEVKTESPTSTPLTTATTPAPAPAPHPFSIDGILSSASSSGSDASVNSSTWSSPASTSASTPSTPASTTTFYPSPLDLAPYYAQLFNTYAQQPFLCRPNFPF